MTDDMLQALLKLADAYAGSAWEFGRQGWIIPLYSKWEARQALERALLAHLQRDADAGPITCDTVINLAYAEDGVTRASELTPTGWRATTIFDGDAALLRFAQAVIDAARAAKEQTNNGGARPDAIGSDAGSPPPYKRCAACGTSWLGDIERCPTPTCDGSPDPAPDRTAQELVGDRYASEHRKRMDAAMDDAKEQIASGDEWPCIHANSMSLLLAMAKGETGPALERIASLESALAVANADAGRYRLLRAGGDTGAHVMASAQDEDGSWESWPISGARLDTVVDKYLAALAAPRE